MNIRLLTLCDGAYNYNGKITVVGTIDNIKVHSFPAVITVGLAVKICFPPSENGIKRIRILILDSNDNLVIPTLEMPNQEAKANKNDLSTMAIVANLQGVKFNEEGNYRLELHVNDYVETLPFKVRK